MFPYTSATEILLLINRLNDFYRTDFLSWYMGCHAVMITLYRLPVYLRCTSVSFAHHLNVHVQSNAAADAKVRLHASAAFQSSFHQYRCQHELGWFQRRLVLSIVYKQKMPLTPLLME